MKNIRTIGLNWMPFDQLIINAAITPKAFESPELKPDKLAKERSLRLMQEQGIRLHLHVGLFENQSFVLGSYEDYLTYKYLSSRDRALQVPCLVHECDSLADMVWLATYLSTFLSAKEPYLARLMTLELMLKGGMLKADIQEAYGISNPSDARRFRRDFSIARNPKMLARLSGYDTESKAPKIPYHLMQAVLGKLRDDPKCIDRFLTLFDEQVEKWRQQGTTAEEETKPIDKWRCFNAAVILRIAESVALGQSYPNRSSADLESYRWRGGYHDETGRYHSPDIDVDVWAKDRKSCQKFLAIAYIYPIIGAAFDSLVKRISPREHGDPPKGDISADELLFPQPSNLPRIEDLSYVNYIRKRNFAWAADPELTFNGLHYKPSNFSFKSYDPYATSTYQEAKKCHDDWWNRVLLREVELFGGGSLENHPAILYHKSVRGFLEINGKRSSLVSFHEFFIELFTFVFREVGDELASQRKAAENLQGLGVELKRHTQREIDAALAKNGHITLTKAELESLIQERVMESQSALRDVLPTLVHYMEEIVFDPVDARVRQKMGSVITLRDIIDR